MVGETTKSNWGCEVCTSKDPSVAREKAIALRERKRLVNESHLKVTLFRCHPCGQDYVRVSSEHCSMSDGRDSCYADLMPLTRDEYMELRDTPEEGGVSKLHRIGEARSHLQNDDGGPTRHREGGLSIWVGG